ncbi:hypothetical protein BDR05DRAFT_966278 [Suillus weaverae]|nr:hypothetical protein BDR05DRAFT_966278 [Suillus weaverae]
MLHQGPVNYIPPSRLSDFACHVKHSTCHVSAASNIAHAASQARRHDRVKLHPCRVKPHPARQHFNCHTYASSLPRHTYHMPRQTPPCVSALQLSV